MTGPTDEQPNGVRDQDVRALIGMLAIIEGHLMVGEVPQHLTSQLRDRLVTVGLLDRSSNSRDLRQAINDLNHRLRYARGEYPEPPATLPVPE